MSKTCIYQPNSKTESVKHIRSVRAALQAGKMLKLISDQKIEFKLKSARVSWTGPSEETLCERIPEKKSKGLFFLLSLCFAFLSFFLNVESNIADWEWQLKI